MAPIPPPTDAAVERAPGTGGARPVRVLLIDDDHDDYILTRDLLAESVHDRYQVDWIASYDEELWRRSAGANTTSMSWITASATRRGWSCSKKCDAAASTGP